MVALSKHQNTPADTTPPEPQKPVAANGILRKQGGRAQSPGNTFPTIAYSNCSGGGGDGKWRSDSTENYYSGVAE
ncbi:MAG: hypothetical protein WCO52_05545 [bacterium]